MKCPYCPSAQGRCATTSSGRSITECASCGHVIEERQSQPHHLFHLRSQDNPLCLVTSDLPSHLENDENDPFEPTGFITAFSTWSIEPSPLFLRSSLSFSGHLAELERTLESSSSSSSSSTVVVDNLRAYMQIIDVASILGLEYEISDHAFQLFRDCCSATCLRNRSVEALATAALVQAIREAQEPRTLQEISIAANVPQKEIGKYIKILGEALQLSQPINSNSISVHMPRFCTLLQLNKSAQELATHIGEVVINKCFCTRRNPISISAAAIYLACQLEDKRKTQAEICKVTGLTEVTLRKVYKELLENWDDLLPSNYTPAVPPERAFPTTVIASGRSSAPKGDLVEGNSSLEREKLQEIKVNKPDEVPDMGHQARVKEEAESRVNSQGPSNPVLNKPPAFWQAQATIGTSGPRGDNSQNITQGTDINELHSNSQELEQKVDKDANGATNSLKPNQLSSPPTSSGGSVMHVWSPYMSQPPNIPVVKPPNVERDSNQNITRGTDINRLHSNHQELEHRVDKDASGTDSLKPNQLSSPPTSSASSVTQVWSSYMSLPLNIPVVKPPNVEGDNNQNITRGTDINRLHSNRQELEHRVDKGANGATNSLKPIQLSSPPTSSASSVMQAWSSYMSEPLNIPPNVVRDNHQGTDINRLHSNHQVLEHKVVKGANGASNSRKPNQLSSSPTLNVSSIRHQYWSPYMPKPQSIPCQNITGGTDINELHSIHQELGHNVVDEDANGATNSLKPNQLSSSAISSENSVMQVWSSYMSQPLNIPVVNVVRDNNQNITRGTNINQMHSNRQELEHKVDKGVNGATNSLKPNQLSSPPTSSSSSVGQYWSPYMSRPLNVPVVQTPNVGSGYAEPKRSGSLNGSRSANQCGDK